MAAVGWDGRDVSGLSHEQIHRWTREGASPEALAAARDRHLARADELRTAADRLRGAQRGVAEGWIGRDADAAGQRTGTLASRMEQLAETVSGQARGVDGMRAALLRVQAAVGPPRPPALPPLGAPPVLGELRALVTGAPADGFGGFRAAAAEQAAAREAYRTYLTETAAAARGVSPAGAGPPPPTAAPPGPARCRRGSRGRGRRPARAARRGPLARQPRHARAGGDLRHGDGSARCGPRDRARLRGPWRPDRGAAARRGRPGRARRPRGTSRSVHGRSVPARSRGPPRPRAARGRSSTPAPPPVVHRPPTPSSPAAGRRPPVPGRCRARPRAPGTRGGYRVLRPRLRPPTRAASDRCRSPHRGPPVDRRAERRREHRPGDGHEGGPADGRPRARRPGPAARDEHGAPRRVRTGGTVPAGADASPRPPTATPAARTPGLIPRSGPLDAAPLGMAPVTGGAEEHRLPPRRTEYLVDPDPAGWGADAARRVAPPVLGEDDDEAGP